MEFLFSFFGIISIIGFIALAGFLTFLVENDKPLFATICLTLVVAALEFFGFRVISTIANNPLGLIGLAAVYIIAGILYGGFRWFRHSAAILTKYADAREAWKRSYNGGKEPSTEKQRVDMLQFAQGNLDLGRGRSLPPKVTEHKSAVVTWMAYWPLSLTWMLIDDLIFGLWRILTRLYEYIYSQLGGTFQAISDKLFSKYEGDFKKVEIVPEKNPV